MDNVQLTFLTDVEVALKTSAGIDSVALTDLDTLPAGAQIRLATKAPVDGYLYALLLDRDDSGVTVLDPPTDGTRKVSGDQAVVVPDLTTWISVPVAGELRVVVAGAPVSASEWQALGGRDGATNLPRNSDGATSQPQLPESPPRPPVSAQ